MCEEDISNYDPVLNQNHLRECLKRLLYLYDDTDRIIHKFDGSNMTLDIKANLLYTDSRSFMEGLYLIVNIGNTEAMNRAVNLPKIWKY